MKFEDMLRRIQAEAGGTEAVLPDEGGAYHCQFGGYDVSFQPLEEGRLLATTVVVATLPDSLKTMDYVRLLEKSFLGMETDGAVFVMDAERRLLARRIDSIENADESFVGELLAKMASLAHVIVKSYENEEGIHESV